MDGTKKASVHDMVFPSQQAAQAALVELYVSAVKETDPMLRARLHHLDALRDLAMFGHVDRETLTALSCEDFDWLRRRLGTALGIMYTPQVVDERVRSNASRTSSAYPPRRGDTA